MLTSLHPFWRQAIETSVRDAQELVSLLGLPATLAASARKGARSFPVLVPRSFLRRIRKGDPDDPLLRQVLPAGAEERPVDGFTADPLDERSARRAPGLLQKYSGRALLIATGVCAMHCRYCFRRGYPYAEAPATIEEWRPAIDAIAADPDLHEVILSGGDPLCYDEEWLSGLTERLAAIPHLRRLRIHSRLPVAVPERVTREMIRWLKGTRLSPVMVVQVNHPQELDGDCSEALRRMVRAGVPVFNQSVLLRGVNDSAQTLLELCEGLVDLGVIPYYIHQLDPVSGAAHFDVPVAEGRRLVRGLRARLPGYAVPRFVQERPHEDSKRVLA